MVLVLSGFLVLAVFCVEIGHAGDSSTKHKLQNQLQDKDYVGDLFNRAESAFKRQDYALSIYCCSQVLDSDPDDSLTIKTLFLQGKAHRALGKYSRAIDDYTGVIRLTDAGINQTLAYSYRAEMYEKLGEKGQAMLDRDKVKASL